MALLRHAIKCMSIAYLHAYLINHVTKLHLFSVHVTYNRNGLVLLWLHHE